MSLWCVYGLGIYIKYVTINLTAPLLSIINWYRMHVFIFYVEFWNSETREFRCLAHTVYNEQVLIHTWWYGRIALGNVHILIGHLGWHNRILPRPRHGQSGVQFTAVTNDFSSPKVPNGCPLFYGYRSFSLEIMRLGREVDHQPPAKAEIKYVWS